MDEYISREATIAALDCRDEYDDLVNTIREQPAADVQLVKHGRWIDAYTWTMFHEFKSSGRGEHFWCSECKQGQKQKSNYCPNCGTRLDSDAE